MLKKSVIIGAVAASLVITAPTAEAGKKARRAAAIFAAVGAVAAIAAAANAARRYENRDYYRYHEGTSPRDNAVAACLHRAHRRNLREGGDGIEFVRLRRSKRKRWGYIIGAMVDRFGPWGVERQYARCKVKRDRVTEFVWE